LSNSSGVRRGNGSSYSPQIFASCASIQGTALEQNFLIIYKRAFIQRKIPKAIRKVANEPSGT
jgi:hypothetical protein